jgi:nucleoside-diphosphate-sugar epimerase
LIEAEQLLLARHPAPIVLRLAGIYGPGRTGLLDAVARGSLAPSTGGPVYTNRIHREDCVGAIVHLLLHPSPEKLYLGADDEPVRRNEILEWLAKQLGPVAPCAPAASTWQRRQPSSNKRCSNARLRASGYAPRYPSYREGYANLMAERATS